MLTVSAPMLSCPCKINVLHYFTFHFFFHSSTCTHFTRGNRLESLGLNRQQTHTHTPFTSLSFYPAISSSLLSAVPTFHLLFLKVTTPGSEGREGSEG